ncbi:hypothetical protein N7474_009853 [Penicillium riverlandense]|uniref:uncharacterized protein n=1 Tax=Penicillium riverlandense TaxID=1903569 RepID=UPI0025472E01|nr:uncharacterized protein N7474_009853 [Penicillium riverlandense]KAJ5808584.1 hypothetical protein N7474_009853 [Penicillium riverlandense]
MSVEVNNTSSQIDPTRTQNGTGKPTKQIIDVAERYDELGDKDGILEKIKAGILHLHRLGLVHNDINPVNILLDQDDSPVICDFNFYTPVGHSLDAIGRTYEWYDENVQFADPRNDLDPFEEICERVAT